MATTNSTPRYLLFLFFLIAGSGITTAFRTQAKKRVSFFDRLHSQDTLHEDLPTSMHEDLPLLGDVEDTTVSMEDSITLLKAAQERQKDLQNGIGRRYVCRTQKGFLNVHKEPGDPFNTVNVVNTLQDGDIVTSTGPPRGVGGWIPHDKGGWSVMMYRGFTFLELIEE